MKIKPYVGTFRLSEENDMEFSRLQELDHSLRRMPVYKVALEQARRTNYITGARIKHCFNLHMMYHLLDIKDAIFVPPQYVRLGAVA